MMLVFAFAFAVLSKDAMLSPIKVEAEVEALSVTNIKASRLHLFDNFSNKGR